MPDADREAMYAAAGAAAPLGRVAEVADVAAAYLYCMTQHFATGTVLTVDGGSLLV
jgi:NAD(P)-dependent dehydrogenase (short-subunit alcohol dehydrogenase family)